MKIEKLTENKIRIILNIDDLKKNNIDFSSILNNSAESQGLLLNMLDKAEEEIGFYTKDCKILIEAFGSSTGNLIFTITKFLPENPNETSKKRKIRIKKNNIELPTYNSSFLIYAFSNFDAFGNFCDSLDQNLIKNINKICKKNLLYLYNNTYYLVISEINYNHSYTKKLNSLISEFGYLASTSIFFERKILEYGKPILKNNAIVKISNSYK